MAVELSKSSPRDLLHHGLVAVVLGYPLAIALSLMLERLMRACGAGATVNQLTMWSVYPLWMAVICAALLMQTRRQCWAWLLAGNGLALAGCVLLASLAESGA
ncbi:MAG: hypothetical protein IV107_18690 [Paucibacter sp.]|nr:hypothetical protein [Roseateles sp.]